MNRRDRKQLSSVKTHTQKKKRKKARHKNVFRGKQDQTPQQNARICMRVARRPRMPSTRYHDASACAGAPHAHMVRQYAHAHACPHFSHTAPHHEAREAMANMTAVARAAKLVRRGYETWSTRGTYATRHKGGGRKEGHNGIYQEQANDYPYN